MTRLSFTTTADVSAPGTLPAVATVWPTSWTLAPTQLPNATGSRPSGPRRAGSSTMAKLPHTVTSATATPVSSSSPPATSSIAATADAPQMEKPVAMRRARAGGTPQESTEQLGSGEGDGDRDGDDRGAADAEVQQLLHPQLQSEQDDGDAEQAVRGEVRADVQRGSVQADVHHESAEHDRDRGRG